MENPHRKYSGPYCSRFGTIAVALGYLTRSQLMHGLDIQVDDDLSGRPHRVIGAISFDQGWMTPSEIDLVLNGMFQAKKDHGVFHLAAS